MAAKQSWDPERYARNARFVADLATPVVELLAPKQGERILDLGCGDGVLTQKLVAVGCRVVGIDGSAPQVAAAVARGLDARVMESERLGFDDEFDAVFSNAALHWMKAADLVIDGVWRALKPSGRFVGEMGGDGCVEKITSALIAALDHRGIDGQAMVPWYFPTVEDYRARLEKRGFKVGYIALIPRPTPLPGDLTGWLETFAETFTSILPAGERGAYLAEVKEALRPTLCDANGNWIADYVRLRFAAVKAVDADRCGPSQGGRRDRSPRDHPRLSKESVEANGDGPEIPRRLGDPLLRAELLIGVRRASAVSRTPALSRAVNVCWVSGSQKAAAKTSVGPSTAWGLDSVNAATKWLPEATRAW